MRVTLSMFSVECTYVGLKGIQVHYFDNHSSKLLFMLFSLFLSVQSLKVMVQKLSTSLASFWPILFSIVGIINRVSQHTALKLVG